MSLHFKILCNFHDHKMRHSYKVGGNQNIYLLYGVVLSWGLFGNRDSQQLLLKKWQRTVTGWKETIRFRAKKRAQIKEWEDHPQWKLLGSLPWRHTFVLSCLGGKWTDNVLQEYFKYNWLYNVYNVQSLSQVESLKQLWKYGYVANLCCKTRVLCVHRCYTLVWVFSKTTYSIHAQCFCLVLKSSIPLN